MLAKVQKWGNSQGVRIPRIFLEELHVSVGDEVEVVAKAGEITIKPSRKIRGRYRLRDLAAKMPDDYLPQEEDWGKPDGREVW
ncbi:MAG: AbrB/MazE/SpoVT family DNA-binding domain-containing protein [Deltaproteobacteria bacterium]|nr:AbrB/MazE/SpoVT family DNA-binding domain-containing protein [Deltaproteobacteria bacterium]